jgi:hypothetical protein
VPYSTYLKVIKVSGVHVYLTFPFVLSWSMLEAMSAGCALVASSTPPVTEVIEDGVNGLLFDFFDHAAIAERVDEVLDHKDRMAAMRKKARQTIEQTYELESCLDAQFKLIDSLIEGKRPAAGGKPGVPSYRLPKEAAAQKAPAKKAAAKKPAAKKSGTKKTAAKKTTRRSTGKKKAGKARAKAK